MKGEMNRMNIKEKFQRMMYGRYGIDQLSKALLGISVVCMLISAFTRIRLFDMISLIVLAYIYYRTFSKNFNQRYNENNQYLKIKGKLSNMLYKERRMMAERKTHHIYKCPNCKQKIRIPKGKGKISITCPKCRTEFIKRS